METSKLEEILDIKPVDNVAKMGQLLELARGKSSLAEFFEGQEQITAHVLKPGEIGGNHVHERKKEIMYVISGELNVYLEDPRTKKRCVKVISAGNKFYLPPQVSHALKNESNIPAVFLETANLAFNPEQPKFDVSPYVVVEKIKRYPRDCRNVKAPAIIGMPGFVERIDGGRIDTALDELSKEGFIGYSMQFKGVTSEESTVICNFNLESYLKDVKEVYDRALSDPDVDKERIGFLASSISGAIFPHFLARYPETNKSIRAYVAISPVMGWEHYADKATRDEIKSLGKKRLMGYLSITSDYDEKRGIERVIPRRCFPELEKLDTMKALENWLHNGMNVMTLVGINDIVTPSSSMKSYHAKLGGNPESLKEYPCGHAIPLDLIREPVKEFFKSTLLK
jgi:mannose-6-phosphate isomerase-like protein (cupin superfamily)